MQLGVGHNRRENMEHEAAARAAFCEAFACGDVAAIAAHLMQPSVRADVLATDAFIVAYEIDYVMWRHSHDGREVLSWYMNDADSANDESLFETAISRGHAHVVEWFFSPSCRLDIDATLAVLLHRVVASALHHGELVLVDFVLSSRVFRSRMSVAQQREVLDDELTNVEWTPLASTRDACNVLIAHGACIKQEIFAFYVSNGGVDVLDNDAVLRWLNTQGYGGSSAEL